MLIRIVKLYFKQEHIEAFKKILESTADRIREFEGCTHMEGYQQNDNPQVFFTYSHWDNEQALNNYRNSEFFKSVWSKTKILFQEKPEAWSLHNVI